MRKLAVIIATDDYADKIICLIEAALGKDIAVSVFMTDKGVFMTENEKFVDTVKKYNLPASVCEHSCKVNSISSRVSTFNYASQFENAKMVSGLESGDRLLLF